MTSDVFWTFWVWQFLPYNVQYLGAFLDPPTYPKIGRHFWPNVIKVWAIIKNKGTPNLLNSSDNIDGTQTFLTQLSAVKLKSIEKRGKIQTTKMNKFSNLNICSTKREPNPQWPLTATIGLNFWSEVGSPIPMTSQWPQTAFTRLLLICFLILDLSSTSPKKRTKRTQDTILSALDNFVSRLTDLYPSQETWFLRVFL